ncbi:MAG: murein L,D-transpeptidase [Burkholderiales bacterium]
MKNSLLVKVLRTGSLFILLAKFSLANQLLKPENWYIQNKLNIATSTARIRCSTQESCRSPLLKQFYSQNNFLPVWSKNGNLLPIANDLLAIIRNAYQDGLNPTDYHLQEIEKLKVKLTHNEDNTSSAIATEMADLDLMLTDAFLLYAAHLSSGKINHKVFYPHWLVAKKPIDLISLLEISLQANDIKATLEKLSPHSYNYLKLKEKLAKYQTIAEQGGWPIIPNGIKLELGSQGEQIARLQQRLLLTGELTSLDPDKQGYFDQNLTIAVTKFQISHGLIADGIVGKATILAMNVPVSTRIRQIEVNMDRLRWFPDNLGETYVFINIPNFSLELIKNSHTQLIMPIIAGRWQTQSCVLTSKINYLEFNPYWYIPDSIASKEMLPKLKQDPEFLIKNKIKIFNDWSKDQNEINPLSVQWTTIDPNNFGYKLRQEPGPWNALGKVKFMFPNQC